MTKDEIARRLDDVRTRIDKAGGNDVHIVAVTKKHSADVVRAAIDAGIADIGENYAQEAAEKASTVLDAQWHFIGQVQRNKVKLLASFVDVWQTVDSVRLAAEIAKRAPGADVFVQVNATDQAERGGCAWSEIDELVESCKSNGLFVHGLMGVAPEGDIDEVARPFFRRLVAETHRLGLHDTSIGMSGDFEAAVQEGGTVLRLGSVLFGPR